MRIVVAVLCLASIISDLRAQQQDLPTVGVAAYIDQLVLPGSELIVRPVENRQEPLVLRIKEAFRHGDSFRYDLIYYGLEPGKYDLRDYLLRRDGSSLQGLPAIPVKIQSLLPMLPIEPNTLQSKPIESGWSYQLMLIVIGVIWLCGLGLLYHYSRRKRIIVEAAKERSLSLADHLAPRIEAALEGTLSADGQAELERMLLLFWRRRLGLQGVKAAEAMRSLRTHVEAGPLLNQLELWLHCPGNQEVVDLAALLAPYRDLPADEFIDQRKDGEAMPS